MPGVLVSYVGGHDPHGQGAPGPILSILDHLESIGELPERVVLLVSATHQRTFPLTDGRSVVREQGGMESQGAETKAAVRERYGGRVDVVPVEIRVNPADLDEVIAQTLWGIRGRVGGNDEVHINVSSGTPAMSAAITFLVDSGHIQRCQVWQSLNPTMLPEGAVRVKRVNLAYLAERDRLDRALAFARAMAFSRAASQFRDIAALTLIPERRPKAAAAASLMQVYALWDRGDYEAAWECLSQTKVELGNTGGWEAVPVLTVQEKALRRVCEDREDGRQRYGEPVETRAILEDLHAGLLRRVRGGQFLSIPTRARRLYEGILNYILYQVGLNPRDSINPKDALFKKLSPEPRRVIRSLAPRLSKPDLAVRGDLVSMLAEAGLLTIRPDTPKALARAYAGFADVRNQSIDEHGLSGVSENDARTAAEAATNMMKMVFPGFGVQYLDHPFGIRATDAVAAQLAAWFGV